MNDLLFDLIATQPSPQARFHGGGQYAKNIFLEASIHYSFDCVYNPSLELDKEIEKRCREKKIILHKAQQQHQIEEIISRNSYKKFYSAVPYNYSVLNLGQCHFIMTIHGLRDIECFFDKTEIFYREKLIHIFKLIIRNTFFKQRKKKKSLREIRRLIFGENKTIITDSEHSKHSILSFFPSIDKDSIKVIYPPYKPLLKAQDKPAYVVGGDFFLLISANRPIKNCYRAIQALDELFSEGKIEEKKVVVIGAKNMSKLQNVNNQRSFIFIDYVPEREFSWFFENAYCFIYPSLNEGYGYPPLYAMRNSVPVLASAITSIPEVCSNAALYFNPFSIEEIKNRILQINNNQKIYVSLQKKGLLREKKIYGYQQSILKELRQEIFENQNK